MRGSFLGCFSDLDDGLEDRRRNLHARGAQAVVKSGTDTGGAETSGDAALFGKTGAFENKDVLHGDEFAFHADAFGEGRDAPRTVTEARNLDEEIDGGADLLAD